MCLINLVSRITTAWLAQLEISMFEVWGLSPDHTNTNGLKITEENAVLP